MIIVFRSHLPDLIIYRRGRARSRTRFDLTRKEQH